MFSYCCSAGTQAETMNEDIVYEVQVVLMSGEVWCGAVTCAVLAAGSERPWVAKQRTVVEWPGGCRLREVRGKDCARCPWLR